MLVHAGAVALIDAAGVRRPISTQTAGAFLKVGAANIDPFIAATAAACPVWTAATGWESSSRAMALGTTSTPMLICENTTAAALGAQQVGGAIASIGRGWETTGSTSQTVGSMTDTLPVQGATCTATRQWKFKTSTAGAWGAAAMTLTSAGLLSSVAGYTTGSTVACNTLQVAGNVAGVSSGAYTGLGTTSNYYGVAAQTAVLLGQKTDAASAVVCATVYLKGSAITNAATMRLHQFSVVLDAVPTNTELASIRCNGDLFACQSARGNSLGIQHLQELVTVAAAASTPTTIQWPAGCIRLGASVRVVTVIPTAATFILTSTGDALAHTGAVAVAAGTTDPGTLGCPAQIAAASTLTITPNVAPAAATGQVLVDIYYIRLTPATS